MINKFHPFHIVELSPWPILISRSVFSGIMSTVVWTQTKLRTPFKISLIITILISYLWWRDVTREAKNQGFHQIEVLNGIKIGIILFISSEILFFVSFFWTYFHRSVRPNIELGQNWPPIGISSFDPINIPLLNTIVLLSSGVSITWSHHALIKNKFNKTFNRIVLTIILGIYFSMLQSMEYWQAEFSISESIYGSIFFIATGFHGIHVIIGSTFLLICAIRIYKLEININHLIGFEAAAWYWHFVDVVWIFLYRAIYWWGA